MDFNIEHLLLFVVAIFLLYHLLYGCYNGVIDGFSVGGQSCSCIWEIDGQCKQHQSGKTFSNDICNKKNADDCVNQRMYGHDIPICEWDSGYGKLNDKVDTITNRLDTLICQLVKSEKCITDQGASDCENKSEILI